VTADGGDSKMVDLYGATTQWQQKVWDTGAVAPGTHTVKIEWTGEKAPAASGTNINVDAFDVTGVLVSKGG
jgi:trimeric autotransporter adhesin